MCIKLILVLSLFFSLVFVFFIFFIYKFYRKAFFDSVTNLYNQVYFREKTLKLLKKNTEKKYSLIATNIAHFRTIYGSYGPRLGNIILRYFAKCVSLIRKDALVARAKEDKFQILLSYKTKDEIIDFLEKLSVEVHKFHSDEMSTKLFIRCGVGLLDGKVDFYNMLSYVELARKEAIKHGIVYYFFNDEMAQKLHKEKEFSDLMEGALSKGEFKVYYQPKYDILTNQVIGAEALVRWASSKFGFLRPDEFIPIFEQNGFIVEIDFFVLEEVCKMLRKELDEGRKPKPVSVNQSRMHLSQPNYIERMQKILEKYNLPKGLVELELTETVHMDLRKACKTMIELKKLGYMLSIDDFGNGYSSFPILFNVPIDTLKIDKDFLYSVGNLKIKEVLLKMVVEMTKELKLNLICEGVERPEHVQFLLANNCRNAQGNFYSSPVSQEDYLKESYLKK